MHRNLVVRTLARMVGVALGLSFAGVAAGQASPARATIAVLGDRFVVGARAFDDLDALEHQVNATRPQAVTLYACGPRASHPVLAAAHRFRDRAVQIVPMNEDDRACAPAAAMPASSRVPTGKRLSGINEDAVERYWRSLMP